jgi:hypothetical protein
MTRDTGGYLNKFTSGYMTTVTLNYERYTIQGSGVVCVREGLDAVAACREHAANPSRLNELIPGNMNFVEARANPLVQTMFGGDDGVGIRLDNCSVLEKHISPFCSFLAPWTRTINAEIKANRGYTIEFWWKALVDTKIPSSNLDYVRSSLFKSSLLPVVVGE